MERRTAKIRKLRGKMTMEEIGRKFGLSKQRISQLLNEKHPL